MVLLAWRGVPHLAGKPQFRLPLLHTDAVSPLFLRPGRACSCTTRACTTALTQLHLRSGGCRQQCPLRLPKKETQKTKPASHRFPCCDALPGSLGSASPTTRQRWSGLARDAALAHTPAGLSGSGAAGERLLPGRCPTSGAGLRSAPPLPAQLKGTDPGAGGGHKHTSKSPTHGPGKGWDPY